MPPPSLLQRLKERKLVQWALAISFTFSGCGQPQVTETGFLDRSMVIDGVEYGYQVFVPRDYSDDGPWPVVLALHGGGSRGTDGIKQTEVGFGSAIRKSVDRYPAIAVFPQSPTEGPGWQGLGGRVAMTALDEAMEEFNIDPSRVYLTGHSQGGNGSWYLLYHHPERFSAAVIVCGWIEGRRGTTSGALYPPIVPDSVSDPFSAVAERISGVPIWVIHGAVDPVVSVDQSRRMVSALEALDADVRYTELPSVGHSAWDPAYGLDDLPRWLFEQRRPGPGGIP